jgi:hypothetical protein
MTLPQKCTTTNVNKKCIPGWNQYVKPYREQSIFWHNLWIDVGKSKTGQIAQIMRSTRAKYHYSLRYIRKNQAYIKNNRLAESLLQKNQRDYWAEIKKVKGIHKKSAASMDGITDDEGIADLFASKYKSLYNTTVYLMMRMK